MQVTPYLNFNGQCKEAFEFYEKVLGGKIGSMMTYGGSPMGGEMPPEMNDRVMHAHMLIGDQVLMASDSPPEYYQKPQGLFVSLHFKDEAEGKRIFDDLAEGGNVTMPFEKTFWASGFGMLTDRYGIPWMVNCEPEGQPSA